MRMDDEQQSDNIEYRRGGPGGRGGRGGLPVRLGGGLGIGGLILVGLLMFVLPPGLRDMVIGMVMGGGGLPGITQQAGPEAGAEAGAVQQGCPVDDQDCIFVSKVLNSTEDVWNRLFQEGRMTVYNPQATQYIEPKLVNFRGSVSSACGMAGSATGPFYCPADSQVYIDTTFFDDMKAKLGAGGDFAEAYVIAHEVGHHIQNVIGLAEQVMRARQRASETEGNALTVRMELQADCFAGVWGFYADQWKNQLSPGDIDEALNAANAIGDDRLQRRSQGYVVPDSFTHGSSEQRMRWFKRGFDSGDPGQCNTFSQDLMRRPIGSL
jgi:hypothetical protein